MSDGSQDSAAEQVVDIRMRVDPVPDKRMFRQVRIASELVDKALSTEVDGFQITASIGQAELITGDSEASWAGLITIEATTANVGGALAAMMVVATRFSDAIRAAYPNAGLVGQPPLPVSYETRVVGEQWKSWGNTWRFPSGGGYDDALIIRDPVRLKRVEDALLEDVDLTTKLIGQAIYWSTHAESLDPETAVLLSAIAVETHAKRVFTDHLAEIGHSEIAEVMFGPRPPATYSAASLYDKVALSLFGKSLRVEHHETYKLVEKIFNLRNDVAHRGRLKSPTKLAAASDAERCATVAKAATNWLSRVAKDVTG